MDETKDLIYRSLQAGEQISGEEYYRIIEAVGDALTRGYEEVRERFSFSAHDHSPGEDPAWVDVFACWMRTRDLMGWCLVMLSIIAIKLESDPAYTLEVQDRDVEVLVTAAQHLMLLQEHLLQQPMTARPVASTVN